jgi:mono/diheme cytochrome c family protein
MKPMSLNSNWCRTRPAIGFVAFAFILLSCKTPEPKTFQQANQAARKEQPATGQALFGLAPGKGRDLLIANCIGCHSPMLIAAHRLDRPRWEETLTTMKKHGLWKLPPQFKDHILEYLVTHQGPLEQHKARETPWAQPLYRPNPLWK